MKRFGITQEKKKTRRYYLSQINVIFLVLIVLAFSVFVFYSRVTSLLFTKDKINVFKEDLSKIAFYFTPIDKEFAKFLVTLDEIIQGYVAGDNILKDKTTQIEYCRDYIKHNKTYLEKLGFSRYNTLMNVFSDLWEYKKELFNLLGKDGAFNYLVILQNTNEKRPNGGFFGSFAFITLDGGRITNLEIIDSYYPDFIAYKTRIMAPDRTKVFLPDRKIGYIAGNKFGFTDIDGKNLKDLYEKMFNETYDIKKVEQTMQPDLYKKVLHQNIKGVFFIRSDSLEKIIPGFTEKIWEWQFFNASVDLIRGEVRGNKKELYIKEVKYFFAKNRITMLQNVVNNFDTLAQDQFLNLYLSNVSTGFVNTLRKHSLENVFKTGFLYARDTNVSFDKVDGFVDKNIQIVDEFGKIITDTTKDIVDVSKLPKGIYTMNIFYTLNVPEYYINAMHALEKKYGVTLTSRELGILAMQKTLYEDPTFGKVYKWRETKATVYFPKNIEILDADGDIYYQSKFFPDFANGLFYQMGIDKNNTTKGIKIKIRVN